MIDFPNSPADQQIFNGPNGVVYQWIAASSLWKALGVGQQSVIVSDTAPANPYNGMLWWNSALGQMFISYTDPNSQQWVPTSTPASQMLTTPGGDFCAYSSAPPALGAAVYTVGMPNIIYSGNSGNWYNPGNGRWTPPPGRYVLMAGFIETANAGLYVNLRKNGANLGGGSGTTSIFGVGGQVPANAGWWGDPQATAIVDANGTDYFDFTLYSGGAATPQALWFMAFPISGVGGPAGPPGIVGTSWRQLQRTVIAPASPQPTFDITGIPADINELMIHYDLTPVNNTGVGLVAAFYDNTGTLDVTSGHYPWTVNWTNHTQAAGTAVSIYSSTSQSYSTGIILSGGVGTAPGNLMGARGKAHVFNIRDAARPKALDFSCSFLDQTNTYWVFLTGQGARNINGAITGLRMFFGTGNIASGAVEVWGSP